MALVTGAFLAAYAVTLYAAFPVGKIGFPIGIGVCFLEFGIWWICRRASSLPDKQAFNWALAVSVLVAWLASVGTHFAYQAKIDRFTFALVSVICLPFYAAIGRRRVILIASLMAISQPVVAFWSYYVGWASGTPRDLFGSVVGSLLVLVLSIAAADLIHATRRETVNEIGGYVLAQKLGEGGMGEVWEGRHNLLARPAAIKLLGHDEYTPDRLRRFEREAQATALLTSEHTVRLFDFGTTEDGRPYYVMELLRGVDLQRLIDQRGALSPSHAVHLMNQVCDSVGEAHDAGIVHRDLKPSNLFLARCGLADEFIKVLDFGLVSVEGGLSLTRANPGFIGTIAYCAPEVLFGQHHDQRSDVFQLGCVMYFLLTGRPLFQGKSVDSVLAHASSPARRPSEFAPNPIPEDLEALVLRCLAALPDERPSSAKTLHFELRQLACFGTWTDEEASEYVDAVLPPSQASIADALRSSESLVQSSTVH